MLRRLVAAFVVLFFVVGLIIAAEVKGTVTENKEGKGGKGRVLTVKVGDKDETFRVGGKSKVVNAKGDEIKAADIKDGSSVTITYEEIEKNGKKFKAVSEVKVTKEK
jgi:hypothetical protein